MRNREYSTRDIDRILIQTKKGIIANKQLNPYVELVHTWGRGDNTDGVVVLHVAGEDILPFEEWLENSFDDSASLSDEEKNRLYNNAYIDDLSFVFDDIINQIQPILDDFNKKLKIFEIRIDEDETFSKMWGDSAIYTVVYEKAKVFNYTEKQEILEKKRINKFLLKLAKQFKFFDVNTDEADL